MYHDKINVTVNSTVLKTWTVAEDLQLRTLFGKYGDDYKRIRKETGEIRSEIAIK